MTYEQPPHSHRRLVHELLHTHVASIIHDYMYEPDYYPIVVSGPSERACIDLTFVTTNPRKRLAVTRRLRHLVDRLIKHIQIPCRIERIHQSTLAVVVTHAMHSKLAILASVDDPPHNMINQAFLTPKDDLPYPDRQWNRMFTLKKLKAYSKWLKASKRGVNSTLLWAAAHVARRSLSLTGASSHAHTTSTRRRHHDTDNIADLIDTIIKEHNNDNRF